MRKLKNKLIILILIILAIIPVLSLFHSGLPIGHDTQDHVARIANFYKNLQEGILVPRWAGNLNWGYGHPILEFLYPMPSYTASFFHFLGFSFVDSTKIVLGLSIFLSGIFMYLWLSLFLVSEAALIGAVWYMYAPYRFVDLYVRGAIGESAAFIFMPLLLYFLYKLSKKNNINYVILGGISLALLILSHNAISLMFLPFILFYIFYLYRPDAKRQFFLYSSFILFLGFALSAFFWIPALIEGKYTLRYIVTKDVYLNSFVDLIRFIQSSWSFGGNGLLSMEVGFLGIVSLILAPILSILLYKKNNRFWILIISLFIYALIGFFLMTSVSSFIWSRVSLLQNFQFTWRFLTIIVFATAVLSAIIFSLIKNRKKRIILIAITIIYILFMSRAHMIPKGYLEKPESFYSGIYNSTTDTGESSPIWSVRFMEKRPNAPLEVIDGDASIKTLVRKSTYHEYEVNVNKKTLFAENTLYFPGWEIQANNKPLEIQYQNMQYRGIMLFYLDPGEYNIKVQYRETKLRAFADAISIVAMLNILGFYFFRFVKRKV